jgi:predicted Fe-Mo cluster-binding NifX family protein
MESSVRILVPTIDANGAHSTVSDHFGRAPYFAIADTVTGEVVVHPNGAADHGSGGCAPVAHFGGSGLADAVACRGLGRRALAELAAGGVPVFLTEGPDVASVLADERSGRFVAAAPDRRHASGLDACGGGSPDCSSHGD